MFHRTIVIFTAFLKDYARHSAPQYANHGTEGRTKTGARDAYRVKIAANISKEFTYAHGDLHMGTC